MRRLTLALLLAAAGLLAACASAGQLAPYPEDCVTAGAPCPPGRE
jgi:hypothetical protein